MSSYQTILKLQERETVKLYIHIINNTVPLDLNHISEELAQVCIAVCLKSLTVRTEVQLWKKASEVGFSFLVKK